MRGDESSRIISYHGPLEDKVIVMAKLEEENTEWVGEELPEYVISPADYPPLRGATDTVPSQVATSNLRRQSLERDIRQ